MGEQTGIIADTHVHLYPCYALADAFDQAAQNLDLACRHLTSNLPRCLFLTERHDCHVYRELRSGQAGALGNSWSVTPTNEAEAIRLCHDSGPELVVVAGRQIVTRERLELLALAFDAEVPDGLPIDEALNRVTGEGGLPVLSWAPGKWFFGRGQVIRRLLTSHDATDFLIGDTSLRPIGWPLPKLMRLARARGFRILAGSDPLPFPGEEKRMGRYGVHIAGPFDAQQPVTSLKQNLRDPQTRLSLIGQRDTPLCVMRRLKGNRDSKRAG